MPRSRDWRSLLLVVVPLLALGLVLLTLFGSRWRERETRIATRRNQLATMRALSRAEPTLRQAVARTAGTAGNTQLLDGRTQALASAALQEILQRLAEDSGVTITSLEVGGVDSTASADMTMLPASITAIANIRALGELLRRLRDGPPVLEVTALSVVQNAVFKGGLLQIGLTVRAPWVPPR
jgi:general secretion pathway protein M